MSIKTRLQFEEWFRKTHPSKSLQKNKNSGNYRYIPAAEIWPGWLAATQLSMSVTRTSGELKVGAAYDQGLWSRRNAEAMIKDGNIIN